MLDAAAVESRACTVPHTHSLTRCLTTTTIPSPHELLQHRRIHAVQAVASRMGPAVPKRIHSRAGVTSLAALQCRLRPCVGSSAGPNGVTRDRAGAMRSVRSIANGMRSATRDWCAQRWSGMIIFHLNGVPVQVRVIKCFFGGLRQCVPSAFVLET
jgi:hypothetical protein